MISVKEKLKSLDSWLKLKSFIRFSVPLCKNTSFKIGGPADVFFEPPTIDLLILGLSLFFEAGLPVSMLGGGSNLLVSDYGIEGCVISLKRIKKICLISPNELYADAGCLTEKVSFFCACKGVQGFENFAKLPGTIGGALFMNARCYERQMSDILKEVKLLRIVGKKPFVESYQYNATDWAYKVSPFQENRQGIELLDGSKIILGACFSVKKGNFFKLHKERNRIIKDRNTKKHFAFPSCGSTFKNNRTFGKPSGLIIEEVGLKGLKIGGAQVSPHHGNFIINTGNATSQDVKTLIAKVQNEVKAKTGFMLEPEVLYAGRE